MKVLICGGRDFDGRSFLNTILTMLHERYRFSCVVHGNAAGADDMADKWARAAGVEVKSYPVKAADWHKYGNAAGPLRNRRMLDSERPDLVIAFDGGKGTADMIAYATQKRVPILDLGLFKLLRSKPSIARQSGQGNPPKNGRPLF